MCSNQCIEPFLTKQQNLHKLHTPYIYPGGRDTRGIANPGFRLEVVLSGAQHFGMITVLATILVLSLSVEVAEQTHVPKTQVSIARVYESPVITTKGHASIMSQLATFLWTSLSLLAGIRHERRCSEAAHIIYNVA